LSATYSCPSGPAATALGSARCLVLAAPQLVGVADGVTPSATWATK